MVNNHMKLLMSSAHFLHKKYGSLGKINKKSQDGNRIKHLMDRLKLVDLRKILDELGGDREGGVRELRKRVKNHQ